MVKVFCAGLIVVGLSALFSRTAEAQVVTSYYAAPTTVFPAQAPVVAAPVVAAPVVNGSIIGTIPMRRGLFGWRTENVPVFASGAMVASVAPVANVPVMPAAAYQSARPIYSAPQLSSTPWTGSPYVPTSSYFPNAVVTSGYRGTAVALPPSAPVVPIAPVQVNTFYPGAVMTMQ